MKNLCREEFMFFEFKKHLAFTLAEVLITLGIIGIVAAMTIPTLLNNANDNQFKVAWKKNFAIIANATNLLMTDNGGSLKALYSTNDDLKLAYSQKFSYNTMCDSGNIRGICWHQQNQSYDLSGSPMSWDNGAGFILADGSLLNVNIYDPACNQAVGNLKICGTIHVDVNGFKGPNRRGKDIYSLWILENKIEPYGADDGQQNSCTVNGATGASCAAEFLYN